MIRSKHWKRNLLLVTLVLLLLGALGCGVLYRYAAVYEITRPELAMEQLMADYSVEDWEKALLAGQSESESEFEDAAAIYAQYLSGVLGESKLTYRRELASSTAEETNFALYASAHRIGEVTLVPKEGGERAFGRCEWTLGSITPSSLHDSLQALTVELHVPAGRGVQINGIEVGEQYLVDPAVPIEDLSELEQRFTPQPSEMLYRVEGLYGTVTVSDDAGNELAPEEGSESGKAVYRVLSAGEHRLLIEAAEGIALNVNGTALTEADATSSSKAMFDAVPGLGYETLRYDYDGIYSELQVTAEYNGQALEPVMGADGGYYFFYPSDENVPDEAKRVVENYFNAYMNYSSHKFDGAALNYWLSFIKPGTELQRYARESRDAMIWASATDVSYDELRFDNFHFLGGNCFSCTILFKASFNATSWYEEYSYDMQNGYEMVFERDGLNWYAVSMTAFGS